MPTSTATAKRRTRTATSSSKSKSKSRATVSSKAANTVRTAPVRKVQQTVAEPAGGISNYPAAVRWLMGHSDVERMRVVSYNNRTFSLDRMRRLLAAIGNPEQQLKCVQVAGTKGKGSTCAMLSSMLNHCGLAVGLYTSPHLVDLRERICVNGDMINYADMAKICRQIAAAEAKLGDIKLSFFEILTAAALKYFADQAVDIAVLETGLGGRLDSTTVVTPLVCGLVQISYDHMNILGDDLASIAREKAGILKAGVPAVSVQQEPAVRAVFDQVAAEVGTTVEYTGQQIEFSYRFEANRELGPHTRVCLTTPTSRFEHLPVPLRGEHQAHNCALALALLDKLKAHGLNLPEDKVMAGLAKTRIAGRLEQVHSEPRVIIDGAHNAASIQALIRSLGAHVAYDSLVVIFGCALDKDITGILKQLALGADKVIFTKAKANPRAAEPEDLMARFAEVSGKMAQTAPSLEDALRLAGRAVSREDLIVVTGSFYLVGEVKRYFAEVAAGKPTRRR